MKIIEPSAEIINEKNLLKRIEYVARTCYRSREKITDTSAFPFVEGLVKRGHGAALEHSRIVVSAKEFNSMIMKSLINNVPPYGADSRTSAYVGKNEVCLNVRDYLAFGGSLDDISKYPMADDFMSVEFVCDIGISRELIRHRQMSFMEQSTRYINFYDGVEFIQPPNLTVVGKFLWKYGCECFEGIYENMIRSGCTPQFARSMLPLSTATRLIVTGMYRQWEDVLKLRLAPDAHPQMSNLMTKLVNLPDFPKEKIKTPTWRPNE